MTLVIPAFYLTQPLGQNFNAKYFVTKNSLAELSYEGEQLYLLSKIILAFSLTYVSI